MKLQLATNTLWRKGDTLCPRTVDFFSELIGKSGHYLTVNQSGAMQVYAICRDLALTAPYHPDTQRAREDARGQSYEPGCHVLQPLEAQREAAGITFDEGDETL